MALPWTAPGYGQGIFPSRAPFFIPETVDPRLVASIAAQREQGQQEISGAIQGALAGLGKMIEQRRQDAIASQLLAGSAPKAEAVGGQAPAAQPIPAAVDPTYAQRGLDLSPTGQPIAPAIPPASLAQFKPVVGTGVPSTALTAAEAAQNRALGFPTQQLMRPSEIYKSQQDLYSQNLGDMLTQARIAHLMSGGGRTGGATQGEPYIWTDPVSGGRYVRTPSAGLHKLSGTTGGAGGAPSITPDIISNIDAAKSEIVYDKPADPTTGKVPLDATIKGYKMVSKTGESLMLSPTIGPGWAKALQAFAGKTAP